jgi:hypothetical protein
MSYLAWTPQFRGEGVGIRYSTPNMSQHEAERDRLERCGLRQGPGERPHRGSPFSPGLEMIPGESPSSTHDPLLIPLVPQSLPAPGTIAGLCRLPFTTTEMRSLTRWIAFAAAA